VWSQGEGEENRYWFPSWDHPNDKFTADIHVTVRDAWVALSNGELTGKRPADDGWTTWDYHLDRPIVNYLVAVSAGDLQLIDDTAGDVPLVYAVARDMPPEVARRTLDGVVEQLPWFENLFGYPYPYSVYRQALVSRFLYGGMENATAPCTAAIPWRPRCRCSSARPRPGDRSRRVAESDRCSAVHLRA